MTGVEPANALVVDDSPTKRYVISSWLRRAGYHVIEAETGAEALAILGREPADVVVLDVRLPDMSGFEVCERIKQDPCHSALPVIHVSATAVDVVDRTQGLTRGADAYLTEPIDPEELLATVQAMLRLYRARQRAERLARRLAGLAETTLAVNTATTFPDLLRAAAVGAARIFDSPALVSAVPPEGEALAVTTTGPYAEPTVQPGVADRDSDDDPAPAGSTLRTDPIDRWPALASDGADRVWVVVARPKNRPPAYVAVPAGAQGAASADDADVLSQLGQALALAVEGMRSYDEERRIALTLQRSLLPRQLPVVPGFDLAVRYVPASATAEVGGDFYELSSHQGTLFVAIGDVVGHSLHAATVMAELRHALRAYVIEGHPPSAVLDRLNGLMLRLIPDEIATMCLLHVDTATGAIRAAGAGHPPPLLISPDGTCRFERLDAPLLGIEAERPADRELHLPPGGTLVLFTDGLVEKRDQSVDDGMAALARSAARVEPDLSVFCDRLLAELSGGDKHDDIAVLVLRRH